MKAVPGEGAPARIITIGGGKGGVGKSIVAANLAVTFSQMGKRVVLADLDLGAANVHLLFGVTRPKEGVQALLEGDVEDTREALTPTSLPNLHLLAGTGAVLGAANIPHARKLRLLRKLRGLSADVVIIDVGAGVGYNALDFFDLGSQKLVVTTPQVTAIHDAYSFLKGAVLRTLHHHAEKEIEAALLEPATMSGESEKVSQILARLRDQRPELANKVQTVLSKYNCFMIGNQVPDPTQAGVFRAVSKMMQDYLGLEVPLLGWLGSSRRVHESVNRRRPLVMDVGGEEARTFRQMAEALLSQGAPGHTSSPALGRIVEMTAEEDDDITLTPPDEAPRIAAAPPAPPAVASASGPKIYTPPPRKRRVDKPKAEPPTNGRPRLPGLTPLRGASAAARGR